MGYARNPGRTGRTYPGPSHQDGTCSVSSSRGLLEGKTLRFLLPLEAPNMQKMTFTNLKAPFFFLPPFSASKALGVRAVLEMVIWINILAAVFSLLWKHPPCGERSRALFEAEFPAVLM